LLAGVPGKKVLAPTEKPDKFRYHIITQGDVVKHKNHFDNSFVEFYTENPKGNFDIMIDQRMFEPPRTVLQLEKRMAEEALAKVVAQK
jgi:hypothetical protein